MPGLIDSIERAQLRRVPVFQAGDRVRVHFQVVEGQRRRTQVFEGIVIKRQGTGVRETFTVRKQSFGVGVERTFPLHSPKIERIEVAARGDVRRAKLYYLRDRVGRASRVRERRWTGEVEEAQAGAMPPGRRTPAGRGGARRPGRRRGGGGRRGRGGRRGFGGGDVRPRRARMARPTDEAQAGDEPDAADADAQAEAAAEAAEDAQADAGDEAAADGEPAADAQADDDSEAQPGDDRS